VACFPYSSWSSLKFCAGTTLSGGVLGLTIALSALTAAFACAFLGKFVNEQLRSRIGRMLQELNANCREMREKIERIRTRQDGFEDIEEDQAGYTSTAIVCVERFLRNKIEWEQFEDNLSDDIAALESLTRNPTPNPGN
jgi:hypothetical protein